MMNHSGNNNNDARNMKKTTAIFLATAMLGSVLATTVLILGTRSAYANECPAAGCADGRMTGGGRLAGDMKVTHGFELHCRVDDKPNNLEINCGNGNHFHLDSLTNIKCIDDPTIQPQQPKASFDKYEADGYGSYNGVPGYQIHFEFTDAGEPGSSDTAFILIHNGDPSAPVLNVNAHLDQGNHQAHKAKG